MTLQDLKHFARFAILCIILKTILDFNDLTGFDKRLDISNILHDFKMFKISHGLAVFQTFYKVLKI